MTFSRQPLSVALLLDAYAAFLRRYVVLSDAQAEALALWILHTFCVDAADATPYLAVTSAEKRSGKSRLLEVLALLVQKPLRAASATEAALFRSLTEKPPPTVLMDEVDAIFGPKARNHEDLRALLNAGHRRGTPFLRCDGEKKQKVLRFEVFGPKALAGIGQLPDTIADRALPIRLKRRAWSETVDPFRERDVREEVEQLRQLAEAFSGKHLEALTSARPELPDELDDRAQEACEPLLAIADLAGGAWPARARAAVVALRGDALEHEENSRGLQLLADIRRVFAASGSSQLPTQKLLEALAAIEEAPWGDFGRGEQLSAQRLAKLLRPYEIRPRDVRVGEKALKGYKREHFTDAFSRYLPEEAPSSRDGRDNAEPKRDSARREAATGTAPSRAEQVDDRLEEADVAAVAPDEPEPGQRGLF